MRGHRARTVGWLLWATTAVASAQAPQSAPSDAAGPPGATDPSDASAAAEPTPADDAPGREPPAASDEDEIDSEADEHEIDSEADARDAAGDESSRADPSSVDGAGRTSDNRRHARTVAVRIGAGVPYLFAIKYGDGSPCESADPAREPSTFCSRLGEPFLDLELSFAPTDRIEVAASVTVALRDDAAALAKARVFGLGIRSYTSAAALVKGFFGARLLLDWTPSDTPGFDDIDVGLQGSFGVQIEPIRWLGIYLEGGVSVRVLRNFSFLPEASGGLQVRFP